MAVSYTHLDVYKRQELHSALSLDVHIFYNKQILERIAYFIKW